MINLEFQIKKNDMGCGWDRQTWVLMGHLLSVTVRYDVGIGRVNGMEVD